VFLIDNVRLRLKGEDGGAGGAGDGGGAGGNDLSIGGEGLGGQGGAGGQAPFVDNSFTLSFDANLGPLAINLNGFSPGPGESGGPAISNATTLLWDQAGGTPGGAAKASVPFTVATQQADFSGPLPSVDLTGYELLADVKLVSTGLATDCATAWMYVWGGGYANDASGEPALGQTNHVKQGEWATVRLDLDGPYGYHSSHFHPTFTPTAITVWGIQLNTWGCPP
jgi:hypothetical protein